MQHFDAFTPAISATSEPALCRLTPGEVIGVSGDEVLLSLGVVQVEARLAVLDYQPEVGDSVLVFGSEADGYYVIGVLATTTPPRPVLARDPKTGGVSLLVENGDLEIKAPRGAVRIASATGVEATSAGPIELCSRLSVRMSVYSGVRGLLSRFGLAGGEAQLKSDRTEVATSDVKVKAKDIEVDAGRLSASAITAELSSERTRLMTGVFNATIQHAYHRVAGLWQVVADRTRTVVKGVSHHSAKRHYTKADDFKVKSDKIHLG